MRRQIGSAAWIGLAAAAVAFPVLARPAPARPVAAGTAAHYPTDGWTLPMAASTLTTAQRSAILLAAGYVRSGGRWTGCGGTTEARIADGGLIDRAIVDLNGDGHPEVIAHDEGAACYGDRGFGYVILTPTATGGWKAVLDEVGVPSILEARGPGGWRDIENGGPGFCFGRYRWAGTGYAASGHSYDGKPCRPS